MRPITRLSVTCPFLVSIFLFHTLRGPVSPRLRRAAQGVSVPARSAGDGPKNIIVI